MMQQGLSTGAQHRVEVGSLFVPTRAGGAQRKANNSSRPQQKATVCRISSLQQQTSAFQDDSAGLLLPPQHLVYPGKHAKVAGKGAGRKPPTYANNNPLHAVAALSPFVHTSYPTHTGAPVAVPVQQREQQPAAAAGTAKPKLRISWAGSGVYFFWQLGAMQYLMNKFHLAKVPMVGASGGSFAAVLSACEVPAEQVLETAYALSLKHNIWERPLGLMGTWGGLVEQWLHDLLPADAAERCSGQVGIVVTQLPFCNQVSISDFKDKTDLINVAMASAHVPMFLVSASGGPPSRSAAGLSAVVIRLSDSLIIALPVAPSYAQPAALCCTGCLQDWKVSRECRGVQCLDGSFPDFFAGVNCDLLQCGGEAVVFDYFDVSVRPAGGRL